VPRVPDFWLDSIIYLYPSEADAWAGTEFGGTGFIVGVPCEDKRIPVEIAHLYFVTNDHMRLDTGAVRFNLRSGGFDVKAIGADEWTPHQDGDDVAACEIIQHEAHKYASANLPIFLTPEVQAVRNFGPGDEVFFIGRYVDHAGRAHNEPVVREGIVSGFPSEPISQRPERDFDQESILVEARSLSGFSGSPVYVTRTGVIERSSDFAGAPAVSTSSERPVYLLGIDWGHHPWREPVMKEGQPIKDLYIDSNSGMMMVVPGAKIRSLLVEHPALIKKRRKAEGEYITKYLPVGAGGGGAKLDSSKLTDEPDGEFEVFDALASKLVRVPKSEIDEQRAKE
jgi:hypothetical protein